MEGRWVAARVAEIGDRTFLTALVDRCVALVMRISRLPDVPERRVAQAAGLAPSDSRPRLEKIKRGPDDGLEPTLAFLAHATLLRNLLQANYELRELAAVECADEIEDFLGRPAFYAELGANRVTRLAASTLREAARLTTMAADTAAEANHKQRGAAEVAYSSIC